jgi:hypothetical protein
LGQRQNGVVMIVPAGRARISVIVVMVVIVFVFAAA